jgi:hypothetical protein
MNIIRNNNFSVEYNTRLSSFTGDKPAYLVSLQGKLKLADTVCPSCGHIDYVENGYHNVENSIICSLGLQIKIGQFFCKRCKTFWSSDRGLIDTFIQQEKEFAKSIMLGCVRCGLSLAKAKEIIGKQMGIEYSIQYLSELYISAIDQIKIEKVSSASGVYNYDEQYLLVNGEKVCRLTVKDAVTKKIIFDKQTKDAMKETIKRVLSEELEGLSVEVFIVDMRQMYPEMLRELYPNVKVQWCIFHLYKIIWKEMQDKFGRNIPLLQLYNIYTMLDIFFDHSQEMDKLQELIKKRSEMKTNDIKKNEKAEQTLCHEFIKFARNLGKERRRKKVNVIRRNLEESVQRFAMIKKFRLLYPKCLQKRINYIDENWGRFTLFQQDSRVQPTNNGIEHYFAATLAKTYKKDFRSNAAVTRELNACKAEWNGQKLFPDVSLNKLLTLAGLLFLAFSPT